VFHNKPSCHNIKAGKALTGRFPLKSRFMNGSRKTSGLRLPGAGFV
jgi:hypothetical protein